MYIGPNFSKQRENDMELRKELKRRKNAGQANLHIYKGVTFFRESLMKGTLVRLRLVLLAPAKDLAR